MRLHHYLAAASGNQTQAILEAQGLVNNAEQQNQTVLRDVDGAINYIIEGANKHPNRIDICKGQVAGVSTQAAAPFGASQPGDLAPSQPAAFGKPSLLGGAPSATSLTFGQPSAFGQPASTFGQSSTFGQPSSLGKPPATAFGQPSLTPGQSSSTFGQPSSMFGRPATSFGQPSGAFGQSLSGNTAPTSGVFAANNPKPIFDPTQPIAPGIEPGSLSAFGQPSTSLAPPPFTPVL